MENLTVIGNKKGTIVYVHGNSSSYKVFSEVLNSKDINQSQIAVKLPGHEDVNQDSNPGDFSMKHYITQLKVFINAIDDDILLVGNSLGGHLVIEIAHEIKNLKGLVIMGTPPLKKPINFAEAYLPIEAGITFLTENPSNEAILEAIELSVFDKSRVSQMVIDFKNTNPKVRSGFAKDLEEQNLEDEEQLFIALDVPKFIIIGDKDPSVNPKYLSDVCEKTKENCGIIHLKDCCHYPSLEKPEAFIEIMHSITNTVFK